MADDDKGVKPVDGSNKSEGAGGPDEVKNDGDGGNDDEYYSKDKKASHGENNPHD